MLLALLHLLRRMRGATPGRPRVKAIRVLETQSLGPRQRVVLIQAKDRQLLLGLSPSEMSLLATFDDDDEQTMPSPMPERPTGPGTPGKMLQGLLEQIRQQRGGA
jgi:flagellar biosynthetic protein FliO